VVDDQGAGVDRRRPGIGVVAAQDQYARPDLVDPAEAVGDRAAERGRRGAHDVERRGGAGQVDVAVEGQVVRPGDAEVAAALDHDVVGQGARPVVRPQVAAQSGEGERPG